MVASLLLVGALVLGQAAAEDAGQTGDLRVQVNKLIRKLDADSKVARDRAEEDLLKLGPDALPFLPKDAAMTTFTADLSQRLAKIRIQLERNQTENSFAGRTVSLDGTMTLGDALASLQKQTGNQAAEVEPKEAKVTVHFDKTPYFVALADLCDQAKLTIYPYGSPNSLQLPPQLPDGLPVSGRSITSGPFCFEPTRVLASRDLRKKDQATLTVILEVAWEPRLHPISVKLLHRTIKATDEQGAAIAVRDPEAEKEAFGNTGASAVTLELPFVAPATPVRQIKQLQGSIRAMLTGPEAEFRFTKLMKNDAQEIRIASAKVKLEEVRKNGDTWEFSVHVDFDNVGDALDSHRNWILQNQAYLEDASGKPIPYDSMETTDRSKNGVGLSYQFAMKDIPPKAVFVYKTPALVVTRDFPYELKNIRLP